MKVEKERQVVGAGGMAARRRSTRAKQSKAGVGMGGALIGDGGGEDDGGAFSKSVRATSAKGSNSVGNRRPEEVNFFRYNMK